MNARNSFLAISAAAFLSGCAGTGPASIAGGDCRIWERPQYVVLGRRAYDQQWIDGNIEAGVAGCGWKRPAARPAEWSKGKAKKPPVKRGAIERFRERVFTPPPALAIPPVNFPPVEHVQPQAPERAPARPPAPAKPRDPVDELLDP